MRSRTRAALAMSVEAVILVAAYLSYEGVRRLVASEPQEAFHHATSIIRLEQRMGIFYEPHLQSLVVGHHWLVTLFNWVYVWGYLPVICLAGIYLYLFHRSFYTRYRNAFLLSGAAGLTVFALLPVAPPRMLPEFGFVDTVHVNSAFYRHFHDSGLVNEFAAVPSFHFGWILLVGLALIQTSRRAAVRAFGVLLPLLMLAAIVLTANHYVLDAAVGAAIVLVALVVVIGCERLWQGTFRTLRLPRHRTLA
jgi:hypothetical protein